MVSKHFWENLKAIQIRKESKAARAIAGYDEPISKTNKEDMKKGSKKKGSKKY